MAFTTFMTGNHVSSLPLDPWLYHMPRSDAPMLIFKWRLKLTLGLALHQNLSLTHHTLNLLSYVSNMWLQFQSVASYINILHNLTKALNCTSTHMKRTSTEHDSNISEVTYRATVAFLHIFIWQVIDKLHSELWGVLGVLFLLGLGQVRRREEANVLALFLLLSHTPRPFLQALSIIQNSHVLRRQKVV